MRCGMFKFTHLLTYLKVPFMFLVLCSVPGCNCNPSFRPGFGVCLCHFLDVVYIVSVYAMVPNAVLTSFFCPLLILTSSSFTVILLPALLQGSLVRTHLVKHLYFTFIHVVLRSGEQPPHPRHLMQTGDLSTEG